MKGSSEKSKIKKIISSCNTTHAPSMRCHVCRREQEKREKLDHGQARDDKFRHFVSKWHTWLVYNYKDILPSCKGMDWGCGEGQSYLVQGMAGTQYLSSNRLLIRSFIRSLTAHRNKFSRTGCIHVIPVQSQSRFTLHTKVCNTQKCQGILTVLRFDLCPPPKA